MKAVPLYNDVWKVITNLKRCAVFPTLILSARNVCGQITLISDTILAMCNLGFPF